MKTKIKQLADDMSTLQEQLLSMPDDLLLAIDPHDNLITVIQHFGLKTKEIKVYLRED